MVARHHRHPGLVPGPTVPRVLRRKHVPRGGPRHEAGVTAADQNFTFARTAIVRGRAYVTREPAW